jgi:hypothetical protein
LDGHHEAHKPTVDRIAITCNSFHSDNKEWGYCDTCTFTLNGKPMSKFVCGPTPYDAYSGLAGFVNSRSSACTAQVGPIPPGRYYIIDRESGGARQRFREAFGMSDPKANWFALYADDGKVDDATFCQQVKRGNFRLHPQGPAGISQGCIVIDHVARFDHLNLFLRSVEPTAVKGADIKAYGVVTVA